MVKHNHLKIYSKPGCLDFQKEELKCFFCWKKNLLEIQHIPVKISLSVSCALAMPGHFVGNFKGDRKTSFCWDKMNCNDNKIQKSWQIEEAKMLMLFHVLKTLQGPQHSMETNSNLRLWCSWRQSILWKESAKNMNQKMCYLVSWFFCLFFTDFHWFSSKPKKGWFKQWQPFRVLPHDRQKPSFSRKKDQKRSRSNTVFWGSGTWGAPNISKASRRCGHLKYTEKASGTSPVFERTWVPYSKSAVFLRCLFWDFLQDQGDRWKRLVHLKQAAERHGIWQEYHASTPWKINMDAQI